MKKNLLLKIACCFFIINQSQAQITFEKYYGGGGFEEGSDVKQTSDGGYIIVGMTQTFGVNTIDDVYLIKTDAGGDTVWTKTFGGASYDKGYSVEQTSDGGYIIAGMSNSFSANIEDVYLIKTDANGNHLWSKTYSGNIGGTGYSVKQTADGGYIIGGTKNNSGGIHDALLIKTDDAGDTLWTKTWGNTGDDYGSSVIETYDGGFVIAGSGSTTGLCLLKTNSDGDTLWTRTSYTGLPHLNYPYTVQETSDSGFIMAGISYGATGMEMYVRKTDSIGNTEWAKTYAGVNNDYAMGIEQTFDGGYIMCGWSQSFPTNGNYHTTVLRLDAAASFSNVIYLIHAKFIIAICKTAALQLC